MKCDAEKLAGCVLGILDPAQSRAIEEHAASCRACGQRLAELRRAVALLEGVPGTESEPVDLVKLRVAIASHESSSRPLIRRSWGHLVPGRRWAVAMAAAACLAILGFRYGVAVRIGSVEIALGGQKTAASLPEDSVVPNEILIRQIAHQVILRNVAPTVTELAQQINEMDARQREAMMTLRNEFAFTRALDQGEVRRNIRLLANGMSGVTQGRK